MSFCKAGGIPSVRSSIRGRFPPSRKAQNPRRAAFRREHDDHALVAAVGGEERLLTLSPCGIVGIVADEAPFLLQHDDVQSCNPFTEGFQPLRTTDIEPSKVYI